MLQAPYLALALSLTSLVLAQTKTIGVCWLRRFQLLYLSRNTGSSIYTVDQSRPYR